MHWHQWTHHAFNTRLCPWRSPAACNSVHYLEVCFCLTHHRFPSYCRVWLPLASEMTYSSVRMPAHCNCSGFSGVLLIIRVSLSSNASNAVISVHYAEFELYFSLLRLIFVLVFLSPMSGGKAPSPSYICPAACSS